jgi:antibiotic biosynthesis monooxygenase (ABM) superfamily enzyme
MESAMSQTVSSQTISSQTAAVRFSRPRVAFLVLLGVYPLVTGLLYLIFPLTEGWTIWQRTLILVPIVVTTMVWGLIPAVQKRFHRFINPVVRQ